jgi:hypothetical protein
MSEELKEDTREATQFYRGMMILAPSALTIFVTAIGWWGVSSKSSEEKGKLEQRLTTAEITIVELKTDTKHLRQELTNLTISYAEMKADVKNIKEDTQETLSLVKEWTSRNGR